MQEISLNIDNHHSSIYIGRDLFNRLDGLKGRKLIFLVDENVHRIHNQKFKGLNCIIIPSGEKHKNLGFVEGVIRKLLDLEADRSSFLIGVGGGLVSDLTGFVASIYMRGIEFGFISSTLLGQVDASIGGKNGVNLDGFKNMIGVFRQPEFIWCDLDLLTSLDRSEMLSGFSEVIKSGAIRDKELFAYCEANHQEILHGNQVMLEKIVADSVRIKVDVVHSDVNELGERKLLNFGHTLGHAIEKLSGMLHGEAIAIGMVMAAGLSVNLGFLNKSEATRLKNMIEISGLPFKTDLSAEKIFTTLLKDKKRKGSQIDLILLNTIGEAFVHRIELNLLREAINDLY